MNRIEIKEWSKEKIIGNKGNIFLGIGIVFAITLLFSLGVGIIQGIFGSQSFITTIFSLAIDCLIYPINIGFTAYMIEFVKDETFNKNTIFSCYEDTLKIIGAMILMTFLTMIGFLFFIIPGIYLAFSYALVPYLLATRKDLSITETLALSRKMMKGHKLDYFIFELSFFGWALLIPFTFGLLLIWLYPYMMTATTKFFVDVMDSYEE